MEDRIIVGLDIGTTKVCAIITKLVDMNQVEILGYGVSKSRGVEKGVLTNIEATVQSIREAVKDAELKSGRVVESVVVGISTGEIAGLISDGLISIDHSEVTEEDVARVIDIAQSVSISSDREVLHIMPREYKVDNQAGISEPIGMAARRLEVEVYIVTVLKTAIINLRKAIERAGYRMENVILQPIASSEAVLNNDEKELGTIVIDVGGGTTDILASIKGNIRHTNIIKMGGTNVTQDISYGLRTPFESAEKIKLEHGTLLVNDISDEDHFSTSLVAGHPPTSVYKKVLAEIAHARLQEIFTLVKKDLDNSDVLNHINGGLVLTGGGANFEGMIEIAEEIIGLPTRIGLPSGATGLLDDILAPEYSTALGLIKFYALQSSEFETLEFSNGFFKRINNFFKQMFQ